MAMNISVSNTFNETIWERMFLQLGSTMLLDTLYVYLITPIGLLGFILNIASLIILFKINNKQTVYIYFKTYTLVGIVVCSILMLMPFVRAPRYFTTYLTYPGSFYRCRIFSTIFSVLLFGTCINICILFERISNFKPIFKNYFRKKPIWVILTCLSLSIVTNIPIYLSVDPRPESEYQEALKNYDLLVNFMYCSRPLYSTTLIGRILLFLSAFISGCVFLVVEIIVNFVSLYKFKKFYKNKEKVLNESEGTATKINQSKSINLVAGNNSCEPSSMSTSNTKKQPAHDGAYHQSIKKSYLPKKNKFSYSKTTRSLTIMSLTFSSLSILTNIVGFVCGVVFTFNNPNTPNNRNSLFLLVLFAIIKYFSSFFLFYYFNRSFRNYFNKTFKR